MRRKPGPSTPGIRNTFVRRIRIKLIESERRSSPWLKSPGWKSGDTFPDRSGSYHRLLRLLLHQHYRGTVAAGDFVEEIFYSRILRDLGGYFFHFQRLLEADTIIAALPRRSIGSVGAFYFHWVRHFVHCETRRKFDG